MMNPIPNKDDLDSDLHSRDWLDEILATYQSEVVTAMSQTLPVQLTKWRRAEKKAAQAIRSRIEGAIGEDRYDLTSPRREYENKLRAEIRKSLNLEDRNETNG